MLRRGRVGGRDQNFLGMQEDKHVSLLRKFGQMAVGHPHREIARVMQRDAVIKPTVVEMHRNADVLRAKSPRCGDDGPVLHLTAHALSERQRERVGQALADAWLGRLPCGPSRQGPHEPPVHRAGPAALDVDGRADEPACEQRGASREDHRAGFATIHPVEGAGSIQRAQPANY